MKKILIAMAAVAAGWAEAGWNLQLDSGWRLVGGANYSGGLKTSLRTDARGAAGLLPAAPVGGLTRAQAEARARGVLTGGRAEFGGGAFIDPDYAGAGVMPGSTWNWHAPAGAYSGGRMEFVQEWREVRSALEGDGSAGGKDEHDLPGFTIELQRNLGQWGGFGVDMGFGFSYFRRSNVFRASGVAYRRTDTVESGRHVTGVEMDAGLADWARNPDGSYGAGTWDGPGALMPVGAGAFTFSSVAGAGRTETHAVWADARADWEELELAWTLKPYYDVTDWFRVVGTFGAGVSRGALDFEMAMRGDGGAARGAGERFREWTVYGVGGLGGMFRYSHMCVGFDFLARFLGDDMDVDGRSVRGKVERGDWTFRVYGGVEF